MDAQTTYRPMEHPQGKAHHWTTDRVYAASVPLILPDEAADVSVEIDAPRAQDGTRLADLGNQYYGPTIYLETTDERMWMHAEQARKLASALLAAADVFDAHLATVLDECGHFAPCDCKQARR